ncbi:phosphoribosyltransferase [Bacteroides sp.]|uniref:phosphoribosyltransferase n=1 Tax=Bacteroides sp. TaxID=29523 RepID=UPI0026066E19|nr:phosphoribosyltransferase [Bacteroides sp.]
MKRRGKICRIDDWDEPVAVKGRSWSHNERFCDLKERIVLHKKGDIYYISQFTRSKTGTSFLEIKRSEELASLFAERACEFLRRFVVGGYDDWCIVTTPRRRHYDGFHFATSVCCKIAEAVSIPFYVGAIQCLTKNRLNPEFFLLRPIKEQRIIVYDDIVTTGSTLLATYELLKDRNQLLFLVGINNN